MTKAGPKATKKADTVFATKLKKVCQKCTPQSIVVYLAAIRRLHKLTGDGEVPATGGWLNSPALMKKYEAQPMLKRRHLSLAAVKASAAYGKKSDKWSAKMFRDQSQYQTERNKNKRSQTETDKWPKQGFKSLKKAAREQRKRIAFLLKEDPTLKNMYPYQTWILLKLYGEVPFRNTFADLSLKDEKTRNYVRVPRKGRIVFIMRKFKNAKQLGTQEITLSRGGTTALRKFIKYREGLVDHDWLFSGKGGTKLTRPALGKLLHRVTKQLLGKSFGSRLIRVLAATESRKAIEEVSDLSKKMLHTTAQTKQYTRKATKGSG